MQSLGFLAQDGILRFIDIHTCKLLFQLGSQENRLSSAHASPDGATITCVSERGNLLLYDVPAASHNLHKVSLSSNCLSIVHGTCIV